MTERVYLDFQAATPLRPAVRAAMEPFLGEHFGNPTSFHRLGLEARDAIATARTQVAAMIGARQPESIVFTSDGTEAANLAIKGMAWARRDRGRHLVISQIEHPAVMESCAFLEKMGYAVTRLPVTGEGVVEPALLRAALTDETILVALHLVNHDLGTIQPVAALSAVLAERGIPFFVEAEAAAGWTPIDVEALGADLLSFSPHRFYGPRGVGVLYCGRGIRPESLIHGGTQEDGRRAGIENVPALVGAGVASEIAGTEMARRLEQTARVQEKIWARVRATIELVRGHGPPPGPGRATNHLNFSVEFTEGEGLVLMLDLRGFQIASGAACLGRAMRMPPVLKAIGVPPELASANIMVSPGLETTLEQADRFVEELARVVEKLRGLSPGYEEYRAGKIKSVIAPSQPVEKLWIPPFHPK